MKLQRFAAAVSIVNVLALAYMFAEVRSSAQPGVSPIVRTRAFELVDANGKVRAQFNTEESGEVVFRLRGPDGTIRTKFAAGSNGSGLVMMDERTEATVQIRADKDGGGVMLFTRDGRRNLLK